jgi:hypothetical protein
MRQWPDECICPSFEGIVVEENSFVVGVSLFLLWFHCTIIVVYFVQHIISILASRFPTSTFDKVTVRLHQRKDMTFVFQTKDV